MKELDTGGEENEQGGQVEAADAAQQPFASALRSVVGKRHQATLISHLPPLYHAMMAIMERQSERIPALAIIAAQTAAQQTPPPLVEEPHPVKAIPHPGPESGAQVNSEMVS